MQFKERAHWNAKKTKKNKNWIRYKTFPKKIREKSRECHNHKPQPFQDTKRKRKQTKSNKYKSNKRTKSTKISPLFPKRGNRNPKRTKNKQGQNNTRSDIKEKSSQNKPQSNKEQDQHRDYRLRTVSRISHRGVKAPLQPAHSTPGPGAKMQKETRNTGKGYMQEIVNVDLKQTQNVSTLT